MITMALILAFSVGSYHKGREDQTKYDYHVIEFYKQQAEKKTCHSQKKEKNCLKN